VEQIPISESLAKGARPLRTFVQQPTDEGTTMAGKLAEKPISHPDTWPGVVSRFLELGSESWAKLIRVCILLALLGGVVWLIASAR
jgi:hypothetical protein